MPHELFDLNRNADIAGTGNGAIGVPYIIHETLTSTGAETKTFVTKVPHSGTVVGARMYGRTSSGTATLKNGSTAFTEAATVPSANAAKEFGLLTTGRSLDSATADLKVDFSAAASVEVVIEIQPALGL